MLAPNAPLRAAVTALAAPSIETPAVAAPVPVPSTEEAEEPLHRRLARYAWALLLARIYEAFPLLCPKCGGEMRLIAFITETAVVRDILAHLGEPTEPPRLAPARGPPLWERQDAGRGGFDPQAQPAPEYNFDQRIAWQGRQEGAYKKVDFGRHGATRACGHRTGQPRPVRRPQAVIGARLRASLRGSRHKNPD